MLLTSKINTKEWEEEQLQSESEVTLVKFDSELQLAGEGSLHHLLQKYSIEERMNFVVNRDRGEIIDINNGKVIETFGKSVLGEVSKSSQAILNEGSLEHNTPSNAINSSVVHSMPIIRNKVSFEDVDEKSDNVWDDYWNQSEKVHKKLLESICQKNNKVLSELFNKKLNHMPINVNYKSFDNWTPIHYAAQHGNTYAIELLLGIPQLYVNSRTNFKLSALHVAAKNNKLDAVRMLVKSGIELNAQDEDGYTALHYAAELGHKDIVSLLLNLEKIDVELRNRLGWTAKEMATSNDIQKLFSNANNENQVGFFASLRSNRQIEKLLMKVNENYAKNNKQQAEMERTAKKKEQSNSSNSFSKKGEGKKESIVRMYQLIKERKNSERVGIESFRFYKKIGEGAFGEVYIVKKGKSEKLYALKAIKKQKVLGSNIMRYIQTEKDVLSLIRHPFIVRLHYAFQNEAYLFLVMDYCEGGDLGKSLEKNKRFDETTVKHYAAEILLALEALHKQRVIYRDLKPDNIVLDEFGHALLTDFGLSKKTSSIDDINKSFCGTPAYLPLEIINKRGHNRMADWYEYGVVLYELYTGIPPFYAETRAELYQNVRAGVMRFPRGTPQAFRDIIKKLLNQNPDKRLGYDGDAESIKKHPWFDGINWDDVYDKKLSLPKIVNKVIIGEPIKSKFTQERTNKQNVSDWSFIAP